MKLRAATLADVPAIAAISLSAFAEDPLYAHFFPFRGKHTHDYQQSFIDEATRFMLTPGHVMLVAEIYEEDPEGVAEIENTTEYNTYFNSNSTGGLNDDEFWCRGTGTGISTPALSTNSSSGLFSPPLPPPSIAQRIDSGYESASSVSTTQSTVSSLGSKGRSLSTKWRTVIVGYASFVRHGTAEERQGWNPDSSRMKLQRKQFHLTRAIQSRVRPNRAMSRQHIVEYLDQSSRIHVGANTSRSWIDFRTLAVDPEYQGRGYEDKMIRWCTAAAKREKVPVYGEAMTKERVRMFAKGGFEGIGVIKMPARVVDPGKGYLPVRLRALEVVCLKMTPA